jgi:hypothetical protein
MTVQGQPLRKRSKLSGAELNAFQLSNCMTGRREWAV